MAITEGDDPNDEDNLPIPASRASASGKKRVRDSTSIQDWSEDDDDCRILDPIDAIPIAYAHPIPSDPANPAGQSQKTRKRARPGTSDAGASAAPDPDLGRPRKLQKKAAQRKPKKMPPTTAG